MFVFGLSFSQLRQWALNEAVFLTPEMRPDTIYNHRGAHQKFFRLHTHWDTVLMAVLNQVTK